MLYSTLRMCISKGTYSSGKHFMVHKSKKVKHTERESEKQPVSDRRFTVSFRVWQLGLFSIICEEGEEPRLQSHPGNIASSPAGTTNNCKQWQ